MSTIRWDNEEVSQELEELIANVIEIAYVCGRLGFEGGSLIRGADQLLIRDWAEAHEDVWREAGQATKNNSPHPYCESLTEDPRRSVWTRMDFRRFTEQFVACKIAEWRMEQ